MQSKGHPESRFIMNLVFNLWNLDDGSDDCVYFIKSKLPKFLNIRMNYFPLTRILTILRHFIENLETFYCRTDLFKYSFFPYVIVEWNKLNINLRDPESFFIFRNSLLKIGRPIPNPVYNVHDPMGIKYLTKLRLGFSHLNDHKFRRNFQD